MKIYDEITNEELTAPDLSAGYLYTARRVAEHVPESREVMQGTVTAILELAQMLAGGE